MFPQVVQRELVRRGWITNHSLIAYSLSNISAKINENWLICGVCYISVVFLDHSVYVCDVVWLVQYKVPKFFSNDLRDLLEHMIQKDLSRRYGNLVNGVNDIKDHHWFGDINWLAVLEKKVTTLHFSDVAAWGGTRGTCSPAPV